MRYSGGQRGGGRGAISRAKDSSRSSPDEHRPRARLLEANKLMIISLNGPQEYGQTVEITRSVKGGMTLSASPRYRGNVAGAKGWVEEHRGQPY